VRRVTQAPVALGGSRVYLVPTDRRAELVSPERPAHPAFQAQWARQARGAPLERTAIQARRARKASKVPEDSRG